jgi:hypothetical protein
MRPNLPKLPKIKLPKPHMVKPVKLKIPKQVKPKLPPHMQGQHTNHPASQQRSPAGALPPAPRGLPAPNTTYDFYIAPNDAPAAPDKSGIKAHLEAEFEMATQHAQNDANFRWTHSRSHAPAWERTSSTLRVICVCVPLTTTA